MTRPVIYISGPLTNGMELSGATVEQNIAAAAAKFAQLEALGFSPIVPHLTWYLQENHNVHLPHDTWIELDYAIIKRSDAVYRLPGVSKGSDMETDFAGENDIPVFYSAAALVNHFTGRVA